MPLVRRVAGDLPRAGVPHVQGGRPMKAGKFDGVPTPPMFEVAGPGEQLPAAPEPFGRGEKAVGQVWCPLGNHLVRVIDDGEHLRYATHWPSRGGSPVMCLTSCRCTGEYDTPRSAKVSRPAPHVVCQHDKRAANQQIGGRA